MKAKETKTKRKRELEKKKEKGKKHNKALCFVHFSFRIFVSSDNREREKLINTGISMRDRKRDRERVCERDIERVCVRERYIECFQQLIVIILLGREKLNSARKVFKDVTSFIKFLSFTQKKYLLCVLKIRKIAPTRVINDFVE